MNASSTTSTRPASRPWSADGAIGAASLEEFVGKLAKPRSVWLMLPAAITGKIVDQVAALMEPGDIIIDGGNSYYHDAVDQAAKLAAKGIHYVDVGTSGGVWGLERGYCLMIGGAGRGGAAPRSDLRDAGAGRRRRRARPRQGGRDRAATATCIAARAAPATSSRWSTTASSTASWPPMPRA